MGKRKKKRGTGIDIYGAYVGVGFWARGKWELVDNAEERALGKSHEGEFGERELFIRESKRSRPCSVRERRVFSGWRGRELRPSLDFHKSIGKVHRWVLLAQSRYRQRRFAYAPWWIAYLICIFLTNCERCFAIVSNYFIASYKIPLMNTILLNIGITNLIPRINKNIIFLSSDARGKAGYQFK